MQKESKQSYNKKEKKIFNVKFDIPE